MNLNQTFAILFRLNYSKTNSKGLVPIWTRITIDGQRAQRENKFYRSIGILILVRQTTTARKSINHLLLLRTEITRHYNILLSSQEAVTAEDVKKSFQKKKERRCTFLELFRQFNKHLEERLKVNDISKRRHQKFRMANVNHSYKRSSSVRMCSWMKLN